MVKAPKMENPSALSFQQKVEVFVHDVLKEELKIMEASLNKFNEEIEAYIELRNTIEAIRTNCGNADDGFKTQMDIGGNIMMIAQVPQLDKILVDLGAGCYLECNCDEALTLVGTKIAVLNKQCNLVRDESVKKRAEIKLALLCLAQEENLHMENAT